jgi:hypothetical protein
LSPSAPSSPTPDQPRGKTGRTAAFAREFARISPLNGDVQVSIKAMLCLIVSLLILTGFERTDLFGAAAFGAFSALFARNVPPRHAMRAQAEGGLTVIAAIMIGVACAAWSPSPLISVLVVAVYAVCIDAINRSRVWRAPAGLFVAFAAGAFSNTADVDGSKALSIFVAAAGTGAFALVLTLLQSFHHNPNLTQDFPPKTHRLRGTFFSETTLVVLIAALAGSFFGWLATPEHAYWGTVTAIAMASRPHGANWKIRALHRFTGTLIGAVIATPLLLWDMPVWATITTLVLAQGLTELFVLRNYAIGIVFITVQALAMTAVSHPGTGVDIAGERLLATVIGLVCGVATIVLEQILEGRERRAAEAAQAEEN